jgi:nicotinic acid mononucleotide adenylyltransferase
MFSIHWSLAGGLFGSSYGNATNSHITLARDLIRSVRFISAAFPISGTNPHKTRFAPAKYSSGSSSLGIYLSR